MGRKLIINKHQVFDVADSAIDPESSITDVGQVDIVRYDLVVDSTVDGTLSVEVALEGDLEAPVFRPLDFGPTPLVINGAVDTEYSVLINQVSFKKIKLKFNDNGGSGNIDAWIYATTRGA